MRNRFDIPWWEQGDVPPDWWHPDHAYWELDPVWFERQRQRLGYLYRHDAHRYLHRTVPSIGGAVAVAALSAASMWAQSGINRQIRDSHASHHMRIEDPLPVPAPASRATSHHHGGSSFEIPDQDFAQIPNEMEATLTTNFVNDYFASTSSGGNHKWQVDVYPNKTYDLIVKSTGGVDPSLYSKGAEELYQLYKYSHIIGYRLEIDMTFYPGLSHSIFAQAYSDRGWAETALDCNNLADIRNWRGQFDSQYWTQHTANQYLTTEHALFTFDCPSTNERYTDLIADDMRLDQDYLNARIAGFKDYCIHFSIADIANIQFYVPSTSFKLIQKFRFYTRRTLE